MTADANTAVVFNRGETYRVSHPIDGGDECTVFTPSSRLLSELLAEFPRLRDEREAERITRAHMPAPSRAWLLHHAMWRLRRQEPEASLAIEETGIAIISEILAGAVTGEGERGRANTGIAIRSHAEQADAARVFMASHLAERWTLADVAAFAGCSVFHLSRVFKKVTGQRMYRYLRQLRVRAALRRMTDGERDLARIAVSCGFYDQSHMTNAFRAEFRASPATCLRTPLVALGRASKVFQD